MKWNYCNYCPLDGTCENQDRGRECEMPLKKLLEENQQLKELLKECGETIEDAWMYCGIATPDAEAILTKIDEVLK